MTRKQAYLKNLRCMDTNWIKASAASPSAHMTRMHVALHQLELRRRQRITNYWEGVAAEEAWA